MRRIKSGETVTTIPIGRIAPGFRRAEFRFEGLRPPLQSYEVRVFAGEPNAGARTPTQGNVHYLGSQFFYGLGVADERSGGGNDPFRSDVDSQSAPTQVPLNVTAGLRAFLAQPGVKSVPVTLVAVDRHGNEIPDPDLELEGVSIVTS